MGKLFERFSAEKLPPSRFVGGGAAEKKLRKERFALEEEEGRGSLLVLAFVGTTRQREEAGRTLGNKRQKQRGRTRLRPVIFVRSARKLVWPRVRGELRFWPAFAALTVRRTCTKLGEHEALGLLLFVLLRFLCLGAKQLEALRETRPVKNSEQGEESGVFCRSSSRLSYDFVCVIPGISFCSLSCAFFKCRAFL